MAPHGKQAVGLHGMGSPGSGDEHVIVLVAFLAALQGASGQGQPMNQHFKCVTSREAHSTSGMQLQSSGGHSVQLKHSMRMVLAVYSGHGTASCDAHC